MKALCFDEDATFSQTHSSSEGKRAKAVETWGTPTSVADVQEVFRRFYQSEVSQLPWYVCVCVCAREGVCVCEFEGVCARVYACALAWLP